MSTSNTVPVCMPKGNLREHQLVSLIEADKVGKELTRKALSYHGGLRDYWADKEGKGVLRVPSDTVVYRHECGYMIKAGGNLLMNGFEEAAVPYQLFDEETLIPVEHHEKIFIRSHPLSIAGQITLVLERRGATAPVQLSQAA